MTLEAVAHRQLLRALADPLRVRIMSVLTADAMSAAQLARALDVSQALASYHLRKLVDAELVELAHTRQNRGAIERMYQVRRPTESVSVPDADEDPVLVVEAVISELRRRLAVRDARVRTFVGDAELWVTPKALARAQNAVENALTSLVAAAAPGRSAGTVPVSATGLVFQMKATPNEPGDRDGDSVS